MDPHRDITPAVPVSGAAGRRWSAPPGRTDRGADDFLAARWPELVRVARALGAPPDLAVDVAVDAADRLRSTWRRLAAEGDPDVESLALVAEAWDDIRRTPWWRRRPPAPPLAGLEALDAVSHRRRVELVLAAFGGPEDSTDPEDSADAADPGVTASAWTAARTIPVREPIPTAQQLSRARRLRRTRTARRLAPRVLAAAVVLAAVAAVTAEVSRAPAPDPGRLTDVAVRDGSGGWLTWWAGGQLHLGGGPVLEVPDVKGLVRVGRFGAVYVDGTGLVALVRPDGSRARVGRTATASSLVVSDDGGLVAWMDDPEPAEPAARVLVVATASSLSRDLDSGRRVIRPRSPLDRPVAVTDDRVLVAGAEAYSWDFVDGDIDELAEPCLLAAGGGFAAFCAGDEIGIARLAADGSVPPADVWVGLPGARVVLAPDGQVAVSLEGDGVPHLLDLATGTERGSGVPAGYVALVSEAGLDRRVAYVVARAADRPRSDDFVRSSFTGAISLLTCRVGLGAGDAPTTCDAIDSVTGTEGTPVLAH